MTEENRNDLGKMLKRRRISLRLGLKEVADRSCVSSSYLGRIERGERFPSGQVLRKVAKPLGYEEAELLTLGGYLSREPSAAVEKPGRERLDPYVVTILSQEPMEVQRAVITILSMLKIIARGLSNSKGLE